MNDMPEEQAVSLVFLPKSLREDVVFHGQKGENLEHWFHQCKGSDLNKWGDKYRLANVLFYLAVMVQNPQRSNPIVERF